MGEQETAHKLDGSAVLSALYHGYGIDTPAEFIKKIEAGTYTVIHLFPGGYVLCRWIGKDLEVLTYAGSMDKADKAIEIVERIARAGEARAVIGLARCGWKPKLQAFGYTTGTNLCFFRKEL